MKDKGNRSKTKKNQARQQKDQENLKNNKKTKNKVSIDYSPPLVGMAGLAEGGRGSNLWICFFLLLF